MMLLKKRLKKTNTTYILFDLRKYFLFLLIIIYKNDMLFSLWYRLVNSLEQDKK